MDTNTLRDLATLQPEHGVVSVYLAIDHTDRRQGWRTALRDRLRQLIDDAWENGPRARWKAVESTAQRISDRFLEDDQQPHARCLVMFYEVSDRAGFESVYELQIQPAYVPIVHAPSPYLAPLAQLIDDYAPTGVLAFAAEQVRLWQWSLGVASEVSAWGFDHRQNPRHAGARQATDPGETVSQAGANQGGAHLEELRERFLRSAGEDVADLTERENWRAVLCFGEEAHFRSLTDGVRIQRPLHLVGGHNLVDAKPDDIAERLNGLELELNRTRKQDLCEQARASAHSQSGSGSLGIQETLDALSQGRVAHLLLDAGRNYKHTDLGGQFDYATSESFNQLPIQEQIVEYALKTGATVTQLWGETAQALEPHEGIAAILRF